MEFHRDYRQLHQQNDLVHFQIQIKETDLDIGVRRSQYNEKLVAWCQKFIWHQRNILEEYIKKDPDFAKTLAPYEPFSDAPHLITTMAYAGKTAKVGPMASVAGSIAQEIGKSLLKYSRDVIVENGGDIFLRSRQKRSIGIYAGKSIFTNRLALEISPDETPLGICTSSGTVGHSLSYGLADAVIILSTSTPLADAVATATGNLIKKADDLQEAVNFATSITNIKGAIAILGDKIALKGEVKIKPV